MFDKCIFHLVPLEVMTRIETATLRIRFTLTMNDCIKLPLVPEPWGNSQD